MCNKHNGWDNYPTWVVNLWMDVSQGSQEFYNDMAKNIIRPYLSEDDDGWYINLADLRQARFEFADWLKEYHQEMAPETGVLSDLVGFAVGIANFDTIARHWVDENLEDIRVMEDKEIEII